MTSEGIEILTKQLDSGDILPVKPRERSAGRAWYAVCIFILLYSISYVDRLILSLLAPTISAELAISDTEIGILIGLGFGIIYAVIGLPLAHVIDGYRRVPLVVAGVAMWSVCTVASGFAPDFTWLMIFRAGVAVGEAVLSPAAISLIADLFPREKRTLPTTLYTGVGAVMYSGSYIAGSAALQLATALSGQFDIEPWRLTIVIVGLPGLLLAPLLFLTVPEPTRVGNVQDAQYTTIAQAAGYLSKERALYGFLLLGNAAVGMTNFAVATWTPTLLIRGHGMDAAQAGYAFGTIGLISSVLGVATWPAVVKLWTNRGRRDALVTVFGMTLTATWICFAIVGLTGSATLLLLAVGIGMFFSAAMGVLVPLLIQLVTPSRMRARVMALYLAASSLIGLAFGPPLAAMLGEAFYSGPFAIGHGLATLVLVAGPVATISIWLIRQPYRNALDRAEIVEVQG